MSTLLPVELGVLGPLQVQLDGTPVAIPGAKPRAILTMLGLHGGSVVSADTLIELLWGDAPPRTAAKALQTHISSLRRALGDGFVLTRGAGWTLAESAVDATRYKSAAKLGRDAAAAGETSQATARFEEALTLWRGIPELPDGPRGLTEKTRWIESHAALVEDRADALLATGRAAEVIGDLEAAVAEAPLRERRWGQLMLALYRAGRQGEALAAYQRARTLLVDQLGVDPGPELRRLEAAIVAQDASLDLPVAQGFSTVTRAVTFLLTDIEGSTAAWEADANAMAIALARHDELVEQVVTSRGGRLVKTRGEGDATFSVFERPSAAAAAAIELQDAIGHEPWALAEPMRIRVALHTGEVELRDGDYFGRAVNRAARLRSLAEGGQILCSGATAELVIDSLSDDVLLIDLGMRQLKNLPRPEHVFELRLEAAEDDVEPASDAPIQRPGLPAVLTGPGPFVGRGQELDRLLSTWHSALSDGVCAMLIAGEPGVGKTRLAGEWSQQAYAQGAVVLYGRCDEDLGAPYQPFAEALRALVPCLGTDRLRGLRGVEALLALVPGLADLVPDLAAPTRADPDTERYALFDAVVAILEVASAAAPVVLILDDLHWAAKPTLLLLRHVLRFAEHARIQIVGTYRSTDVDRSHPLGAMLADLHRDGTASRLQLTGLDADDVTAYVAEAGYDDEELARALASVTGGNPFFLIEALRHVDESGGVWDQSTLPQGVRDAVSRRLSRLPAETNKALAAAAVVGSRFALDLVEQVVGDDLIDAFDEASKAGIVIEEPGGYYRFNHALVRQSLLAELASVRRMRLHQRIATTLEAQPGADDELLAELAHHYFECAWAGNAAKAAEYCRRAADQAMARLAYEGAADLYDHALHALEELDDELPDRDEQAAELLVARCEALLAAGDVSSSPAAVAQLRSATVNSARLAAWATSFDGELSMLIHPERLDEVEAALAAAAETLAGLGDAAGEAKAHTVRASCLARLGRIGDCEVALDDALTAARRAREHRRVNAVLAGAPLAALWGPNPVPRAGGRCLDVVRLLRITTDSPAVEATSTRCQAVLEAFRGRAEAARRMIDSARRTVTELGLRHALLEVEQFAGIVELVVDDPVAAEPCLREAYNGFRRMRLDADTAETAALLGRACLALERDAEADELSTESERLAGNALKASIAWRTLRAQLLSRRGEHEEARQLAEAAVTLAERTDALVDHGDARLTLAKVLDAAGDVTAARAAAERAADLYERKGAAALAERAHSVIGQRAAPAAPAAPEPPSVELDNEAARAGERVMAAVHRKDWDEFGRLFAPDVSIESRRKVVGLTLSSDAVRDGLRRELEMDTARISHVMVAARGERLALSRLITSSPDASPGAPQDELLQLYAIDDEGRVCLQVWFDVEDMDAALAELDAMHARETAKLDNACVRAGQQFIAAFHRRDWAEIEQLYSAHAFIESRRKIVGFSRIDSDEWIRVNRRNLDTDAMRFHFAVVAVRGERLALFRLRVDSGDEGPGAPYDEFLSLCGIDADGRFTLQLWFDPEDVDAAIAELDADYARFEQQPHAPRLENAAAHAYEGMQACFKARDWEGLADKLTDDVHNEDRRRVVNLGIERGREAALVNVRRAADLGVTQATSNVIVTRGSQLVLTRARFAQGDEHPDSFGVDVLQLVEVDANDRIAALVMFDLDDFDAAIAELDARFLAGEAAPYAHMWSMIMDAYAAINRHELPPTVAGLVTIDHRRAAAFASGEMIEYLRAGWELGHDITFYVEAVHRIGNLGAVVTHVGHGSSRDGFDAEWREINLLTAEGDIFNRCEVFDEEALDAALVRFDELSQPTRRLENASSQGAERFSAYYAAGDWQAMANVLADNYSSDDRRRVVGSGVRHGRDAHLQDMRARAALWLTNRTSTVLATRGERLALLRLGLLSRDQGREAFLTEVLIVNEINADGRLVAGIAFDLNDFDAAIAELDARYLAGEAAPYSRTWSAIVRSYSAINRREQPAITPNWVTVDHRRETAMGPGDLIPYLESTPGQDNLSYVEVVHRLSDLGAVITYAAHETSQEGFDAEWRGLAVLTVDGDMVNRCEVFDDADLDVALARFEELQPRSRRLENAASRVVERVFTYFEARDWIAMAELEAEDICSDDRRSVVNAGIRRGRDAEIADMRAIADIGVTRIMLTVIATRGERLMLCRFLLPVDDQGPSPFRNEALGVVEINAENRVTARLLFDPDDIDAAFAELDARYVAGEAAAHAHTWSVIAAGYAALNRREQSLTTTEYVQIDHRLRATVDAGELSAYLRATWELMPDLVSYIEAVHRLSDVGAVVTHAGGGTSQDGFDAEWREVDVLTLEGELLSRCEIFDEADIDAAIARFDELHPQTPRLENAASQAAQRFLIQFAKGDWATVAETIAHNFSSDDRRRVVGAGIRRGQDAMMADLQSITGVGISKVTSTPIATRGERLVLTRGRLSTRDHGTEVYFTESLAIVEIDTTERIVALVNFDLEDLDAAYAELDARYLAGEAAAFAHTWTVFMQSAAALNRRELFATTPDWVNIDHRRGVSFAPGEMPTMLGAWNRTSDFDNFIEAVHRLNDFGGVITHVARETPEDGFHAEWRVHSLITLEGDRVSRCEVFDEADVDAALARFDELQPRRLENAASRADDRLFALFAAHEWDGMADLLADSSFVDDRRHAVNAGFWQGRDVVIANMRALEAGANITSAVIATRGERLALTRIYSSNHDPRHGEFTVEMLITVELDIGGQLAAHVMFDPDDIDAAFAELDSRYLAGEAATHAHTWSVIARECAAFNRYEPPTTTPDPVYIDHRPVVSIEGVEMAAAARALRDLTPAAGTCVEAVHRLSELGAVVTQVVKGASPEGFNAEWHMISIMTVEGELISRFEVFDEADLDTALNRFDELDRSTRPLDNAATQIWARMCEASNRRDLEGFLALGSPDLQYEDRRKGLRDEFEGSAAQRKAVLAMFEATPSSVQVMAEPIALRGSRLSLMYVCYRDTEYADRPITVEMMQIVEVGTSGLLEYSVSFDADDIDAAFEEIDARYLAGEAATYSQTWSVITQTYAAVNRRKLPPTTPDWLNIDHRRGIAFAPGEMTAYIRAGRDLTPDTHVYVQTVHRLNNFGAVVTQVMEGTSQDGFDAEWREIGMLTVKGDLIHTAELFDEADLDAALARFEELGRAPD